MKTRAIYTLIALAIMANSVQASVIYRWTTPDGKDHIADVIPNDSLKYGYEVINKSTWEIKKVPPEEAIEAQQEEVKKPKDGETEESQVSTEQAAATEDAIKKAQEQEREKHVAEVKRKINDLKIRIGKLTQGNYSGDEVRQKMMVYQKLMNRLQEDLLESQNQTNQ